MSNLLTEGRKALIKRLSSILVENNYATQAGANVRTGWFNEQLEARNVAFPLIVVQKGKGLQPVAGPHAIKVIPGFNVVGAVDAGLDGYEDSIEELEQDLLRCLMPMMAVLPDWLPRGITGISVGAPETFPPAKGTKAAAVVIPVYLTTIIQDR
ncbi:hypothetical protein [Pseudomonas gingeri]|uniref:hypothetical protein n=1 Tax=Pseudomonas gingeri TaxID=117681 RepID=UPI0015BC5CC8|nr:hypothetical protein [Pseudomonas gingeri]NWD49023.1 hypothetical protein [Pseudomonas gingeri]